MANYYTHFSFVVPFEVQSEMASKLLVQRLVGELGVLIQDAIDQDGNDLFAMNDIPYGLSVEAEGTDVWIHDDAGEGCIEPAVTAVRWLLDKPGAPGAVGFEWANTCSKPRVDGFGGGAVLVTRDDSHWMTTGEWLAKALQND